MPRRPTSRRALLIFADEAELDLARRGLPSAALRLFQFPSLRQETPFLADIPVFSSVAKARCRITTILGPSRALALIAGLKQPDSGTVYLMVVTSRRSRLNAATSEWFSKTIHSSAASHSSSGDLRDSEATLAVGPATEEKIARLAGMCDASEYSLELRVSIEGFSPETNDPIRGPGTFVRAKNAVHASRGRIPSSS